MTLLRHVVDACIPGARNSYRPHLLNKTALSLFLAVALVAEGYYVLGLFGANPSEPFLAAALGTVATGALANWALIAVAVILVVTIVAAIVSHAHMPLTDIVLPGAVILGIVVLLVVLNTWYGGAHG